MVGFSLFLVLSP
jgi:hypothetical protein